MTTERTRVHKTRRLHRIESYVGRLAPSPTGSLHLGIARTSLAAWLDARAHDGRLLLRIEDIDLRRNVAGSQEEMMRDLLWLGIDWDQGPDLQTDREGRYRAALSHLRGQDRIFSCTCSRKEIALVSSAPHGQDGPRYPGTCRNGYVPKEGRTPALRLRTEPTDLVRHVDRRCGALEQNVHDAVGDFILKRADGMWAYQLAVSVDDLEQGVTCIVRGEDLLGSTPRQLLIRRLLDPEAGPIDSLHVPLLLDANGKRMAKRHEAEGIGALREQGASAEVIVGQLAVGLGLLAEATAIRAEELIPVWREHCQQNLFASS